MSLERQVMDRCPARASSDTPKRATTSLTTEQAKANLLQEIAAKQAELASLQEQAIAQEDGAAEPSKKNKYYISNLLIFTLQRPRVPKEKRPALPLSQPCPGPWSRHQCHSSL